MVAAHEQQQQLSNHNMTNGIGNVKKRKSLAQNSYSEGNLKPFVKSEASKYYLYDTGDVMHLWESLYKYSKYPKYAHRNF